MNFLGKIQRLPESKRKIILWAAVIIFGLGFLIFWAKTTKERLRGFHQQEFIEKLQIPDFGKELKQIQQPEMPKLEIPEPSEEELKQLEEIMKTDEQQSKP